MTGALATGWPGCCLLRMDLRDRRAPEAVGPVYAPQRDLEPLAKLDDIPSLWVNHFPTLPGELRAEEAEMRPGGLEAWPPTAAACWLQLLGAGCTAQRPGTSRSPCSWGHGETCPCWNIAGASTRLPHPEVSHSLTPSP